MAVNKFPAGVCCGGVPLFGCGDVPEHVCAKDVGMKANPRLHSLSRIKSEHLFRQLVSVTGGMQAVS